MDILLFEMLQYVYKTIFQKKTFTTRSIKNKKFLFY